MRVSLLSSGSARAMMILVLMVRGRIIMGMLLPTATPLRRLPLWMLTNLREITLLLMASQYLWVRWRM
jgi:hypothetical protein